MKPFISMFLFLLSYTISAQSSFVSFQDLKNTSEEKNTPILLVFSGSDWCKPCIQLKKKILDTPEFESFADNLTFQYLDFPYKKANRLSEQETERNESLAEKFNEKGLFPKVVLVDHNEAVLGNIVYQKSMTTEGFINEIRSIIEKNHQ